MRLGRRAAADAAASPPRVRLSLDQPDDGRWLPSSVPSPLLSADRPEVPCEATSLRAVQADEEGSGEHEVSSSGPRGDDPWLPLGPPAPSQHDWHAALPDPRLNPAAADSPAAHSSAGDSCARAVAAGSPFGSPAAGDFPVRKPPVPLPPTPPEPFFHELLVTSLVTPLVNGVGTGNPSQAVKNGLTASDSDVVKGL